MKTIKITATTTVGAEDEENAEEILQEVDEELNATVWDFDITKENLD